MPQAEHPDETAPAVPENVRAPTVRAVRGRCLPCRRRGQKQRRKERRQLMAADLASRNRHRRIAYARERAAWWATELDRLESEAADSAAGPAGQPS